MKKVMFLAVLAVLVVSLFGWVAPVLADNGDNFQKAGQKVLAEKEQALVERKAAIEAFIVLIAADRVITGDEMITLNKAVDAFARAKAEADKYLKFYGLKTTVELDEDLVKMTKNYYKYNGFFKRDDGGVTRAYFVRLTGGDVVVLNSGISIAGGEIFFMIFLGIILLLCAICACRREWFTSVAFGCLFVVSSLAFLLV